VICPNSPTHHVRREPSNKADGPGWQGYCAVCAEFFEPCTKMGSPMTTCVLAKGHKELHRNQQGDYCWGDPEYVGAFR